MTSFRNSITTAVIVLLLACCSCGSKTQQTGQQAVQQEQVKETESNTTSEEDIRSIPQLLDRLTNDSVSLSHICNQYPETILADFRWCDSMLQYLPDEKIDEYFPSLNLAQLYLGQFNEMLPVMNRDMAYIRTQLNNLQNDIDTHYISDSLAAVYLLDEIASADTLHNRILYFQDRLSQQDQVLKTLRETISKAASK